MFNMETIHLEYKEFYLNYLHFDNLTCRKFIKHGFNKDYYDYCLTIFSEQFKKNIVKYISSFNNSNINGKIIFGIRDDGVQLGIPFIISQQQIYEHVYQLLELCKNYISDPSIFNNVKINIIKLNNKNNSSEQKKYILQKIIKHNTIVGIQQCKFNSVLDKLKNIKKNIEKYRCKISFVTQNKILKRELVKYINKKCKITKIRKQIKKSIETENNFNPDYIKQYKFNKRHLMFWVTSFRDIMTDKYVKKLSVTKQYLNSFKYYHTDSTLRDNIYVEMCKNMSYVQYFSKENFYIIECEFYFDNNFGKIKYLHNNGNWCESYRIIDLYGNPKTVNK